MTDPIRVAHVTTVDLTLRFLLLGQLRRLRDEGFEVTAISAPGPWTAALEAEGIRHLPWRHATRAWDPPADALAFLELLRLFRRERFDLVHTHNPKPGVMGRIAARMAGVPCVVNTVHGLYATPDDPRMKRLLVLGVERLAARFSDLELYQSEEDLWWARSSGIVPASRSELLGNGTDLAWFDPGALERNGVDALRRELDVPEGGIVVGTIGRLVREKGYVELFGAAREVRKAHPEVRFLVVGGPDPSKPDALPEEELAGAADDVIFTGWREDVRELLALMDVFVLPSWREGVPRSAIEAAAMGKALVLTDVRGSREVVRDGVEGLLVPARDPTRLAAAIGRLIADPGLRRRLGSAARARAHERFDERRVEDLLVRSYGRLLQRKGLTARGTERFWIRPARRTDAAAMARLHRDGLPGAFLPSLGDRFLTRLYHMLARDRDAVALVAESRGDVVGFAAAVASVPDFYRRFYLRHGLAAAVTAAPRLLRPSVLRRARETAAYPGAMRGLPESELLAIAVAAGWRTQGVGRLLAEGILLGLAHRGISRVRVVVGADNEGANRFYARMGFRRVRQVEVHGGRASNVWLYEEPSPRPEVRGRPVSARGPA